MLLPKFTVSISEIFEFYHIHQTSLRFATRLAVLLLCASLFRLVPFMSTQTVAAYGPEKSELVWVYITAVIVGSASTAQGAGTIKACDRIVGTFCGAVLGIIVAALAQVLGGPLSAIGLGTGNPQVLVVSPVATVFMGIAITAVAFGAFYVMVEGKFKWLLKHEYSIIVFMITFGMVALSSYESANILTSGIWRIICVLLGCVLATFFVVVFLPVSSLDVAHKTCTNIFRLEAKLIRSLLRNKAAGITLLSLHEMIARDCDDEIHRVYMSVLTSLDSGSKTLNFAKYEWNLFQPLRKSSKNSLQTDQYRILIARLRRLAITCINMDFHLRMKPQPPIPSLAVASAMIELADRLAENLDKAAELFSHKTKMQSADIYKAYEPLLLQTRMALMEFLKQTGISRFGIDVNDINNNDNNKNTNANPVTSVDNFSPTNIIPSETMVDKADFTHISSLGPSVAINDLTAADKTDEFTHVASVGTVVAMNDLPAEKSPMEIALGPELTKLWSERASETFLSETFHLAIQCMHIFHDLGLNLYVKVTDE